MKIFISYSHKDEAMLEELSAHMSYLERSHEVKTWSDKQLLAGDNLDSGIMHELSNCDIAIFLLSSDFLSSKYCIEIELETALEHHKSRGLRIFGVVLRPCIWNKSPLKNYRALPKDGKPIQSWDQKDEAYHDVVEEIVRICESETRHRATNNEKSFGTHDIFKNIKPEWRNYISSTDIAFQHKNVDTVFLSDIYTYPDLLDLESPESERTYFQIEGLQQKKLDRTYLIYGVEQAGKTSLAKMLFRDLLQESASPILVNGPDITTTNIETLFSKRVKAQYLHPENFGDNEFKFLIIDNFHRTPLNKRHQETLLQRLKEHNISTILLSDTNLRLQEYAYLQNSAVHSLEILPFGHVKRQELIRKWNEIGVEEIIDEGDLLKHTAENERQVNEIIRKNLVPPRPVYILTILQSLQSLSPSDYRLTSYGHCYNYLIQSALKNSAIAPQELDSFFNLLTRLAYFIYKQDSETCSIEELETFLDDYGEAFFLPDTALNRLESARLITRQDGRIGFSHKYVFYYFTGKAVSELDEPITQEKELEYLCTSVHRERNANILIFVTHHSRSIEVIEEIALHSYSSFQERKPATLSIKEVRFLADRLQSIPDAVIEHRDAETERRKHAEFLDSTEASNPDLDEDDDELFDGDYQDQSFVDISSSAKSVEIIGQILKNRHGSLSKDQILTLAEACVVCGLRFLDFFLALTEEAESNLVSMIANDIDSEKDAKQISLQKRARSLYIAFCYGGVLSVLQKVGSSIGHQKLLPILDQLEQKSNPRNVAVQLVNVIVKLDHSSKLPRQEIKDLYSSLEGNVVAQRLLKEIVVNHIYLHYLKRHEKQWIATELGIPIKTQQRIEGRARLKLSKK